MPNLRFSLDGPTIQALVAVDATTDDSACRPLLVAIADQLTYADAVEQALLGSSDLGGVFICVDLDDVRRAYSVFCAVLEGESNITHLGELVGTLGEAFTSRGVSPTPNEQAGHDSEEPPQEAPCVGL